MKAVLIAICIGIAYGILAYTCHVIAISLCYIAREVKEINEKLSKEDLNDKR